MLARLCLITIAGLLLGAPEKEAALGVQLAGEIRKSTAALGDSTVEDYIRQLGLQLAEQADDGNRQWEFAVIRDDVGGSTHEPLSVPGGHIFVTVPLILAVKSEAELAGMMAHSMAHTAQQLGIAGDMGIPLVFVGSLKGDRTVLPAAFVKIQRANELDEDRAAVSVMAAAGYDPAALVSYLRRGPAEDRVSALKTAVANVRFSASQAAADFQAIQDRVRGLITPPKKPVPTLRRKGER